MQLPCSAKDKLIRALLVQVWYSVRSERTQRQGQDGRYQFDTDQTDAAVLGRLLELVSCISADYQELQTAPLPRMKLSQYSYWTFLNQSQRR